MGKALIQLPAASSEKISPDQYRLFDEAETDTEVELEDDKIIVPARIQVIRHIRKQYACKCGQCIRTAALPKQPIIASIA